MEAYTSISSPTALPCSSGNTGKTLDAIERLLNCIVNRASLVKRRVFVDTEGYRERREERLVEMAYQVAEKVRYTDREVILAPMSRVIAASFM